MRQSDLAQVDWAGGEKQAVDKVSRERGDENAQVASCSPGGGHSLHQGIHLESSSPGTRCHEFMQGHTIRQAWVKHCQQTTCTLTLDLRHGDTSGMVWSGAAILQRQSSWSDRSYPCHYLPFDTPSPLVQVEGRSI